MSMLEGSRFGSLIDQNPLLHASAVLLVPAQSGLQDLDFDKKQEAEAPEFYPRRSA